MLNVCNLIVVYCFTYEFLKEKPYSAQDVEAVIGERLEPYSPSMMTYRILITGLMTDNKLERALELKDEMLEKGFSVANKFYGFLMDGHANNDNVDGVFPVYEELKENHFTLCLIPNCLVTSYFDVHECRKGDYYRYLAEFKSDQERKEATERSLTAYKIPDTKTGDNKVDAVVIDEESVGSVDSVGCGGKILRGEGALSRYLAQTKLKDTEENVAEGELHEEEQEISSRAMSM